MIRLAMTASETTNILDEHFEFEVPEKTESLRISILKNVDHYLTMAVFDSEKRLRGQFLHGGKTQLVIHSDDRKSTPYTISGPIPGGKWYCAVVGEGDYHDPDVIWGGIQIAFNQDSKETFADRIWVDTDSYPYLSGFDDTETWKKGTNWYKGDLHTHTVYSDGAMTREEIVTAALGEGLDFIVNTDHNVLTTSWPQNSKLLVIPGIEFSFYHGHANVLNPECVGYLAGDVNVIASQTGMLKAFEQSYGEHSLVTINHPVLDEWTWQYGKIPLAQVDALEIINAPSFNLNDKANEWAISAWDYLLNAGWRIPGVGGSDVHGAPGNAEGERVGDPATFVYSEQLSARSVMAGIKAGHVIVSRGGFIHQTFKHYLPGEQVAEKDGAIECRVDTNEPVYVEWIVDGAVVQRDEGSQATYRFRFEEGYHWVRATVRYKNGHLFGVTNPFFFGKKKPAITHWQSVIDYLKRTIPETTRLFRED